MWTFFNSPLEVKEHREMTLFFDTQDNSHILKATGDSSSKQGLYLMKIQDYNPTTRPSICICLVFALHFITLWKLSCWRQWTWVNDLADPTSTLHLETRWLKQENTLSGRWPPSPHLITLRHHIFSPIIYSQSYRLFKWTPACNLGHSKSRRIGEMVQYLNIVRIPNLKNSAQLIRRHFEYYSTLPCRTTTWNAEQKNIRETFMKNEQGHWNRRYPLTGKPIIIARRRWVQRSSIAFKLVKWRCASQNLKTAYFYFLADLCFYGRLQTLARILPCKKKTWSTLHWKIQVRSLQC